MKTTPLPDDFDPRKVIVPEPVQRTSVQVDQLDQRNLQPAPSVPTAGQPMVAAGAEDVPVEQTRAEHDASYFEVADELPTGLAFSTYSKLSVRPLQLPEKYKLGASRKGGKIKYVIDAVGATIDRPIMQMALIDFWFLCYWLRTMSYKKEPLVAEWSCENNEHVRKVILEEEAPETLHNKTIIEKTDVTVVPVADELKEIAEQLMAGDLPIYIHPPTVADFLERVDAASDWDDEFAFTADIAVYLRSSVHGAKIVDRVKFLRANMRHPEAEEKMDLLKQAIAIMAKAGTNDMFDTSCSHCLAKQKVLLEVDLLTFFPV